MAQVYGDFRENLPENHEFLLIGFSPGAIPIQQRWRNNGISADFIADYLATLLSASEDRVDLQQKRLEVKGAVSYIANELLENAMKFHHEASQQPIRFGMHLIDDATVTIALMTVNSISQAVLSDFKRFVEEFLSSDPEELYLRQLEKSAEGDDDRDVSGLGILTMKNDYQAKVGWKVEASERNPTTSTLITMVQVEL